MWLLLACRLEGELSAVKQKRAAAQSTLRHSHKETVQLSQQGTSARGPEPAAELAGSLWVGIRVPYILKRAGKGEPKSWCCQGNSLQLPAAIPNP